MSKRHCSIARSLHGVRVLREDEIWNAAVKVWEDLPSSKVANAFVIAGRIAKKIIHFNGRNDFLSGIDGTLASNVRLDFIETEHRNDRRDGEKLLFTGSLCAERAKGGILVGDPIPLIKYQTLEGQHDAKKLHLSK